MLPDHSFRVKTYFDANKHKYDFHTIEGCGRYTEDCLRECLRPVDDNWGLLKYNGNGTKYNGHRIDSVLYRIPEPGQNSLLTSVDIIKDAETNHASSGWSKDQPRYTLDDWIPHPQAPPSHIKVVPWVGYNENGFNRLKKMLIHDYARRPQGPDFDVSVWAARCFHNQYMGPEGIPLGELGALQRVKKELCESLGIPNDNYLGE